jgi:hypothetical protein
MSEKPTPESELRSAYNRVMESGLTYFWERTPVPGVNPDDPIHWYRNAWNALESGDSTQAERWARAARHGALALWHEAKIAWLSGAQRSLKPHLFVPRHAEMDEEYHLHADETREETQKLLESISEKARRLAPSGGEITPDVNRILKRAATHLAAPLREPARHSPQEQVPTQENPSETPGVELLRAEHLKAAHEYALCLESLVAIVIPLQQTPEGLRRAPEKNIPSPPSTRRKAG